MYKDEKIIFRAILAGIYIAVAAIIYLIMANANIEYGQVIGAFLFSIALLVICNRNYYLYTGKAGYLIPAKKEQFQMIGLTILGNFVGIILIAFIAYLAGINNLFDFAKDATAIKLSKTWYQILASSFFCGILMYTAVDGHKNITSDVGKTIIVIFSVVIFILAGFEHSIANMFYFIFSQVYSFKMILYLLIMLIGNGLGAILVNLLHLLLKPKEVSTVL